jgi:hypothetical protein
MLRDDFARQRIDVDSAITKDFDSVAAVDDGTVWPDLERPWLTGSEGVDQFLSGQFTVLVEFGADQGAFRMQ